MEIEIRHEKVWFVETGKQTLFSSCAECGGQMLTVDEAAQNTARGARMIFQMIEAGQIHFRETSNGSLLVCVRSLSENEKNIKGEIEK